MSKEQEVSGDLEIINPLGLHARAASKFVSLANKFDADVWLYKDGTEVNAKSILGVLMLACAKGSIIGLKCAGDDARECYDALAKLVSGGFGEI